MSDRITHASDGTPGIERDHPDENAPVIEEGEPCPEKCGGKLKFPPVVNCSCHIDAPCSQCTNNPLTCDQCGWEDESRP